MFCHIVEPLLICSLLTPLPLDSALQSLQVVSFPCSSLPLHWDNPKPTLSYVDTHLLIALCCTSAYACLASACLLVSFGMITRVISLACPLDDPLIHFFRCLPYTFLLFWPPTSSPLPFPQVYAASSLWSQPGWDSVPSCQLSAPCWARCPLQSPAASAELCSSPARS